MGDSVDSTTATLRITMRPGSGEYKRAKVINNLRHDPRVADVEWLDQPTPDDQDGDSQ